MKKRIYSLAALLFILVAAGFFLGRHIYLHCELPRTVENIAGEWFLRKLHACNVDPTPDTDTAPDADSDSDSGPDSEDEWTVDFPTDDHDIYMTAVFDAGGYGCLEIKHEGPRIVHAWHYHWVLLYTKVVSVFFRWWSSRSFFVARIFPKNCEGYLKYRSFCLLRKYALYLQ